MNRPLWRKPRYRAHLERATDDHGQSVSDYIEGAVLRALADAGLIKQSDPEGP